MKKILIATHGHFASGIKSSLNVLLGNSDIVTAFDGYVDESRIQDKFEEYFSNVLSDDQVIMISDIYGGSVNQLMYGYLSRPNTYLITGLNLPILLELAISEEELSEDEINQKIESVQKSIQLVKQSNNEEAEDFF